MHTSTQFAVLKITKYGESQIDAFTGGDTIEAVGLFLINSYILKAV